ncbi:uncharacterized protein MELLADRAFT_102221 [Melampsora larici-populina 98AG31]|uniref:Uncharacterized protein n=1 Tax=Melampsora larici-populina (strain 98AG31 / pathotype 3-4-7) TaxID=747676 RepID=F4R7K7_MELLP|nr:uncharacterized protein MELLADRAFT_102221 [Melampsora larici-populina 98AG31]EGG11331.1 hypothetical protein MELLADRAFT_102221 [Melampsora larici-populina 98AG31]
MRYNPYTLSFYSFSACCLLIGAQCLLVHIFASLDFCPSPVDRGPFPSCSNNYITRFYIISAMRLTINGDVFGDVVLNGVNSQIVGNQAARILQRRPILEPARVLRRRQVPQPVLPAPARVLRRRRIPQAARPQPPRELRRRPVPQNPRRYSCVPIPSHQEDPIFWDKVFKLPHDFLQYISPTCDLRDHFTTCRILRDIILYFNPGYQLPLNARKSELIKTFQDLVICLGASKIGLCLSGIAWETV